MLKESERDIDTADHTIGVDAGRYLLERLPAGATLRITDLHGNQAVDTLFFDATDPTERYCAITTIRNQGNLYLTTGTQLLTGCGTLLLDIVADTCGRHDTLGGACSAESNTVRYAIGRKHMHSCRDSWMLALAEHPEYGLTKRDIGHNINFFMNVPVTTEGGLTFEDGISDAGKYVELVARRDVLVLISNCPQLNNPCNAYNPTPIELRVWLS